MVAIEGNHVGDVGLRGIRVVCVGGRSVGMFLVEVIMVGLVDAANDRGSERGLAGAGNAGDGDEEALRFIERLETFCTVLVGGE